MLKSQSINLCNTMLFLSWILKKKGISLYGKKKHQNVSLRQPPRLTVKRWKRVFTHLFTIFILVYSTFLNVEELVYESYGVYKVCQILGIVKLKSFLTVWLSACYISICSHTLWPVWEIYIHIYSYYNIKKVLSFTLTCNLFYPYK